MADAWGGSWGNRWGVSWGTAPAVAVAAQESLIGGKKAKKRHWPVFDDDDYYAPKKIKPVVVSNIVKPKDDFTEQIKLAVSQRQGLVAEIARLRKAKQLTAVGIAKISELRHSRSLLEAEIKRLRKLKDEDEEMQAIALIVSELFH